MEWARLSSGLLYHIHNHHGLCCAVHVYPKRHRKSFDLREIDLTYYAINSRVFFQSSLLFFGFDLLALILFK